MPKLRILYDEPGWAFHRQAQALEQRAPADFEVTLGRVARGGSLEDALGTECPDVLFVMPRRPTKDLKATLERLGWSPKVVRLWAIGWPVDAETVFESHADCDWLVFNHSQAWLGAGRLPRTSVIANGVDLDTFAVRVPPEQRRRKVIWTGSVFHESLKGHQYYVAPLFAELRSNGIECESLLVDSHGDTKRSASEMAAWYNDAAVLLCASRSEGTPNPALEAAACGCTIVSTRVGNMPDLIRHGENGYLVDRTRAGLLEGVGNALANYERLSLAMQQDIQQWDWRQSCEDYYDLFRHVLQGETLQTATPPRLDLQAEVTAFVSTVGSENLELCLDALRRQDCKFRVELIENVAPMSAAFQQMIDRCETPYYIQVDEDMVLHPHAVRTLWERIEQSPPTTAASVANLYDPHVERMLRGVKIFRHDIVNRYPFRDLQGCDIDQMTRAQADGFEYLLAPLVDGEPESEPLGLHHLRWTRSEIYERFYDLEKKRRLRPDRIRWVHATMAQLLERYLCEGRELDFFAILGAMAARSSSDGEHLGEKDYRQDGHRPGFENALRLFDSIQAHTRPGELQPADFERLASPILDRERKQGRRSAS